MSDGDAPSATGSDARGGGDLTGAGRKLFLSQSALSHQLREIENELGVGLLHRSKRRMIPTAAGVTSLSLTKVPTTDAIIELVRAGMAVAVLNRWSVLPHLQSKQVASVPLGKRGLPRTWYAAISDDRRQPPYIPHFIGCLTRYRQA